MGRRAPLLIHNCTKPGHGEEKGYSGLLFERSFFYAAAYCHKAKYYLRGI